MVRALGDLGYDEGSDLLTSYWDQLLGDRPDSRGTSGSSMRAAVVRALISVDPDGSIALFKRAAIDPDPAVASAGVEALGRLKDHGSFDLFVRYTKSPAPVLREAAFTALGRLKGEKAHKAVTPFIDSGDKTVLAEAAYSLSLMGWKLGLLTLEGFIEETDGSTPDTVRAAGYLARLGKSSGIHHLARSARKTEGPLRTEAIRLMGLSGQKGLVQSAADHLRDEDPKVRLAAVEALERIGEGKAEHRLKKVLEDSDEEVRARARRALAVIGYYVEPKGTRQ